MVVTKLKDVYTEASALKNFRYISFKPQLSQFTCNSVLHEKSSNCLLKLSDLSSVKVINVALGYKIRSFIQLVNSERKLKTTYYSL